MDSSFLSIWIQDGTRVCADLRQQVYSTLRYGCAAGLRKSFLTYYVSSGHYIVTVYMIKFLTRILYNFPKYGIY